MKYYYSPGSTAVVTTTVLNELGLGEDKVQRIYTEIYAAEKQTKTPEFLKINPNGLVPVLVLDDGTVMYESAAINIYLGETFGAKKGIYPSEKEASKRALCLRWIVWSAVTLSSTCYKYIQTPKENSAEKAEKKKEVDKLMQIIEDGLKKTGKSLIEGFECSVPDLHIVSTLTWVVQYGNYSLDAFPAVKNWYNVLQKRKSVADANGEKVPGQK